MDATRSSRPLQVMAQNDVVNLEKAIIVAQEKIGKARNELEARASEQYLTLLKSNTLRLYQIAEAAMYCEPTETLKLSKLRGQYDERLVLLREIQGFEKEIEQQKSLIARLSETVSQWREKMKNKLA